MTIAVIALGIGLYMRFNGNPIIKLKLNKESENYLRQNYPEIADKVHCV